MKSESFERSLRRARYARLPTKRFCWFRRIQKEKTALRNRDRIHACYFIKRTRNWAITNPFLPSPPLIPLLFLQTTKNNRNKSRNINEVELCVTATRNHKYVICLLINLDFCLEILSHFFLRISFASFPFSLLLSRLLCFVSIHFQSLSLSLKLGSRIILELGRWFASRRWLASKTWVDVVGPSWIEINHQTATGQHFHWLLLLNQSYLPGYVSFFCFVSCSEPSPISKRGSCPNRQSQP